MAHVTHGARADCMTRAAASFVLERCLRLTASRGSSGERARHLCSEPGLGLGSGLGSGSESGLGLGSGSGLANPDPDLSP